MHVGPSTYRLTKDAMPRHGEVRKFAEKLAELSGYNTLSEHVPSRIVLLSSIERPIQIGKAWNEKWDWRAQDVQDDIEGEYKGAELGCTEEGDGGERS